MGLIEHALATRRSTRISRYQTRANYPHKLTKPPGPGPAAEAASGGSELHGGMAAAHRSLRIPRQSRRPPCRGEAGTWGGFAA
jgi:hypothetical protein